MKIFGSITLILLTIPLFIITLLTATFKFQLLEPKMWENVFAKNNTYSSLTTLIKQSVIDQTVKQGGRANDIKIVTDLITTENITTFVNRNLENILNFANGKTSQFLVYIPVNIAPAGLLPMNFENLPETMTLSSLMTKLNIAGPTPAQINTIPVVGKGSIYFFAGVSAILVLFLLILFVMTPAGGRFIGPGISFILNGAITLAAYFFGVRIQTQMATDLVKSPDTAQMILGTVAPPIIASVLKTWLWVGVVAVTLGILCFFLRKRV